MSSYDDFLDLEDEGIDLVEILSGDHQLDSEKFLSILRRVQQPDDQLYSDLLHMLSHRRFSEEEAKRLWKSILKHKRRLTAALGRNPGVRLSALDYLSNVRGILSRPRILDSQDFRELLESVQIDDLTGLHNRRHLMNALQREVRRARRYSNSLTLMLIDVDNFKQINDRYGHPTGDRALVELSRLLQEVCRETDTIGRYGGDEILVLLPETRKSDAYSLAERIRHAAEQHQVKTEEGESIQFSLSIGLATYPDDSQEAKELLSFADEALYTSKHRGRNAVSLYEQNLTPREPADPTREQRN